MHATALSLDEPGRARAVRLLDVDPDLADGLAPQELAAASAQLVAATARLSRAPGPQACNTHLSGGFGLLLLEGLVLRRVRLDGRVGGELLGPGDLLRLAQEDEGDGAVAVSCEWKLLEPARVACLDAAFTRRVTAYPDVHAALVSRAIRRARHLAITLAIVHQPRVEARVSGLLWHLAGRWGKVRSDGVLLPKRLSHLVLAELVASNRPTVTMAIGALERNGSLARVPEGWLLHATDSAPAVAEPAAAAPAAS